MKLFHQLGLSSENFGAFSGFNWVSQNRLNIISSKNPHDGSEIAKVWAANQEDVNHVLKEAHNAFEKWRNIPAAQRGVLIKEISDVIKEKKSFLSDLIVLEMGKSKSEAMGEVQEIIDMADFAVGQSRMLYGKMMHSERTCHRLYEQWHPLGVVGIFTSFNFPMAVWAWNAFIAAICGNVVVWKPSSKTPLCAIALQKICQEKLQVFDYPAVFSLLIPESRQLSQCIIQDQKIPLISFTGSSFSGQKIATMVAERFGRSILELGGNNAVILDESANLKLAIPAIVFGAVGTAGQRCTSTRRVFIVESKYEEVKRLLVNAYRQIRIGDPLVIENHMGPLIDEESVSTYKNAISHIIKDGGKIIYGGKCIEAQGFYVEPTLVEGLTNANTLVQKETFAPILYLFPVKNLKEAIILQNDVPQGLSSALFSEKQKNIEYFLSVMGSDCGIANVNVGTSGAEITGAFGGEKATGGGREAGSDAWKAYMRRQTTTINWGENLPLAQGIKFEIN